MSKKSKILLLIVILSTIIISFIGGTFSKYASEVKGSGVAEVASWNFMVNGQDSQVQTINLASTCNNETLINKKIAPGTSGSFNIVVDGTGSDVGIDYKIKFSNETTKPSNLKFIYENVEYNSITELEKNLTGTINANDDNKSKTLTINWKWKYETGSNQSEVSANDSVDTTNAKEIANYAFNIAVTGTQVVPQA